MFLAQETSENDTICASCDCNVPIPTPPPVTECPERRTVFKWKSNKQNKVSSLTNVSQGQGDFDFDSNLTLSEVIWGQICKGLRAVK